jgi:hypothetical protein
MDLKVGSIMLGEANLILPSQLTMVVSFEDPN